MIRVRTLLRAARRDERGQALILFAAALIPMLGIAALVLDVGQLYVKQRELRNAADAAALAGSALLPGATAAQRTAAITLAEQYAELNGADAADLNIIVVTRDYPYDTIVVTPRETVDFTFARVFGMDTADVEVEAAAQVGSLTGGVGVMPWGVEEPASGFVFGDSYCLKLGSNGNGGNCSGSEQGNFHALDIDDHGNASANIYRDAIRNGSTVLVRVGDHKDVAPGNMQGPTSQGTGCTGNNGRITGNTQTFDDVVTVDANGVATVDWGSPRIVLVPVVDFVSSTVAEVLGFAVFYIEGCGPNGSVNGTFVQTSVSGTGEWSPIENDTNYGAHAARLVY